MTSKGRVYRLLSALKESPEKRVYKALIQDKAAGAEQEALLKIFINRDQEYQGELESLLKNPSPLCPRLLGFESFYSGRLWGRLFGAAEQKALVLEYISGVSLARLSQRFALSAAETGSLLASIYKGLKDLQKAGLCHGDLSLDNVLADQSGGARLIDFGKGNYQGQMRGTLPFAAPEILKGGQASFLSDLFSLGVIEFALRNPDRWLQMKKNPPEDFAAEGSPLLDPDPQKRYFPYAAGAREAKAPPTLAVKVRDILSLIEGEQARTEDLLTGEGLSGRRLFKARLRGALGARPCGAAPAAFSLRPFRFAVFFAALFLFAGASSAPLPPPLLPEGTLQVFTNKWFWISAPGFRSYAPFSAHLPPGKHTIRWKTAGQEGEKRIHIEPRKVLFLKDKDFLEKPL